jgi:hypothetical protein
MVRARLGFVSNSSSSSFVIGKYFLTDEQISYFQSKLDDIDEDNEDGYIAESKYYFQGEVDQQCQVIDQEIKELDIEEFCSWEC